MRYMVGDALINVALNILLCFCLEELLQLFGIGEWGSGDIIILTIEKEKLGETHRAVHNSKD